MEEKTTAVVEALRYVDFITSDRNVLQPILAALSNELQLPIIHVAADPTRSGPRRRRGGLDVDNIRNDDTNAKGRGKEDYAIETFTLGEADFGRL